MVFFNHATNFAVVLIFIHKTNHSGVQLPQLNAKSSHLEAILNTIWSLIRLQTSINDLV